MRIAVITHDFPMPPGTGLNLVIHNLVRGLVPRHEVRFFILDPGYYGYNMPAGSRAEFPWPFEEFSASFTGTCCQSRRTLSARYYRIDPLRIQWLATRLKAFGADRVVGFDYHIAPYLTELAIDAPRILDAIDSQMTYLVNQLMTGAGDTSVLKHLIAAWLMGVEHIRRCDAVLTVSPIDTRNIRRFTGAKHVYTVPNGVDHEFFAPDPSIVADPTRVVFCGSLSFVPNRQAVAWFLSNCWPLVCAAKPDATLAVLGKNPPQAFQAMIAAHPGAECVGDVADVRPHILRSTVSIAPMITGSGVKNKILEAWSLGVPVVATRMAASAIECTHGRDILVATNAAEFARYVTELLVDPALRERLTRQARAHVVERYDWEKSRAAFTSIVEEPGRSPLPAT